MHTAALKTDEPEVMGEVRAQIKLTNLVDWTKAQDGMIPAEQIRSVTADAMVDTGSARCTLPQDTVNELGLKSLRSQKVQYADGREEEVAVVGGVIFEVLGRQAEEEAYVLGDEVLIGQTLLEAMDLLVDCHGRRLIPNPAHPQQPVTKVK